MDVLALHVLDVFVTCLALYYFFGRLFRTERSHLPPGPPGWPLIGNLLDFPAHEPYKAFGIASRKHGPVISYNVMNTRYIVLHTFKATKDLLEKKSAITSDRPRFTMAGDLVGWDNATVFLQYGDACRKHRKFFHRQIGAKSSLESFHPVEEEEAKRFVRKVMGDPEDLIMHCRRTAGSVVLKISHGYSVQERNDPLVEMADDAMRMFAQVTTPGRYLVDAFPILRFLPEWFPGGGFHRDAKRWRQLVNKTAETPYNFVLERLAKNNAAPSFTSKLLQEGVTSEDEAVLKWASFSMYLGGSDTTPSTLSAFFLAMTIYPEILRKAQTEVDVVVGRERLPTIQDRERLPYVNAVCMELLRWHVVSPMAIHVSTEDILYEGQLIPRGAWVIGNIWFILSDPETYPDPDRFEPERFLGEDQQPDPREACFGWGRRACPGAHLADLSIFTHVVMALATLEVSRCIEGGVECIPSYDVEEGMIRRLKPFKCRIASRSNKAEELVGAQ